MENRLAQDAMGHKHCKENLWQNTHRDLDLRRYLQDSIGR